MTAAIHSFASSILPTTLTGYSKFRGSGYSAVALNWAVPALTAALSEINTLHDWAACQPMRMEMRGRGVVYGVPLPGDADVEVVVRRNIHGGLLRKVSGDIFVEPTRAPYELAMSLKLHAFSIPTPEIIAYAIYPLWGVFARSDVVTRRLPRGADVPTLWHTASETERDEIVFAMARLLKSLADAGAWHADLNLKNIYVTSEKEPEAYILDVDRVKFLLDSGVAACNLERLTRSIRKWRTKWGLDFSEDDVSRLAKLIEVV